MQWYINLNWKILIKKILDYTKKLNQYQHYGICKVDKYK